MRKWFLLFVPLILISCKEKIAETYFTPDKALVYFSKVEEICNADSGRLWGTNLFGPLMFIDRTSRKITANRPDDQGLDRKSVV